MSAHIEFDLPDWEAERIAHNAMLHGLSMDEEAMRVLRLVLDTPDFAPGLPDDSALL